MNLSDITRASFQFHRAIYISLTEKCPIRCRHCFVDSGPERNEFAQPEKFEIWFKSLIDSNTVEIFIFSGGEPFNNSKALKTGLKYCLEAKTYSIVCSSCFWATSVSDAEKFLDKYPAFDCLWISTDVFHEEFVPLNYLQAALTAAKARNIDVVFQIVEDADFSSGGFLQRFEQEVDIDLIGRDQIYLTPLSLIGRAESNLKSKSNEDLSLDLLDVPCTWLGTPWLREDGTVCACPNIDVFRAKEHSLHLGNLNLTPFDEISEYANRNILIQALRVFGPVGILNRFPVERWGIDKTNIPRKSICEVCHALTKIDNVHDKVQKYAKESGLDKKIDALRLVTYSEILHITGKSRLLSY